VVAVYSPPPRHLTFCRCIALLYFAIRLESRKSVNKRIYLSIYLSIAPAAEAPIVFRTYQRRGMNRHEIGVKILGGEGSRPCRSPPTPQPWTWLGYGYTITCPRALHCPAAAAHGQCLAITGNAAPSINQSINRSTVHAASRGPSADPRHRGRATHASAARRRVNYTQTCACASAGVTKLLLLLYLLFTNTQLYFHRKM